MDTAEFVQHGGTIVDRLTTTQAAPPWQLVVGTGVVALVLVVFHPTWRVLRNVVTIAHEGGHAFTALLTGRRLNSIRLHSDTSGLTVSSGKPYGLGMILTMAAGYPAPALVGLAYAALLGAHRITLMLWLTIALLLVLLLKVRNFYGLLSLLVTGGLVVAVSWFGTDTTQAALAYAAAWFLLLAAVRPVIELQRNRAHEPNSDADQLAYLTRIPGILWVLLFGAIAVCSLVLGARLLLADVSGICVPAITHSTCAASTPR
ncbi:M50 family metallopeptidase [Nocardia sp. CDC153]|uniref:M50 family metallopeptidase n=1 Tax=Nocardia sp. CDC153 TaxID=3112167 RepID=UPI002DB84F65|nr:M50 family metallopeptidase [Nocardia sp. CDC153]MEC3957723.1 M50 family metallopeptidase [Nocardia sp. CDC153]